jgi:hypothetical protein
MKATCLIHSEDTILQILRKSLSHHVLMSLIIDANDPILAAIAGALRADAMEF